MSKGGGGGGVQESKVTQTNLPEYARPILKSFWGGLSLRPLAHTKRTPDSGLPNLLIERLLGCKASRIWLEEEGRSSLLMPPTLQHR